MAISYDQRKKSYEGMDDTQKQQYNEAIKNKGDDYIGNQYMKQYNDANSQNQNGTNGGNQTYKWNPGELDQKVENQTDSNGYSQTEDGFYTGNSEWEKAQNREKLRGMGQSVMSEDEYADFRGVSPDLEVTKFNQAPGKVEVKEGTAQQTGLPDYQASSQARLDEMKRNLDQYFQDSPRMFQDRETFNRVFEYDSRDSEAQKQLLDSYWRRKQDIDKANSYTSGEAIYNGMNNAEITSDQLNYIKEYNQDAYIKWQQIQEDEVIKRIVNGITPPAMEDIATQINTMIERLGIQADEALNIEGIYNETMDRTQAYQTLEDCNRTVKRIEEINNKRVSIMNRYASSTGGTTSDALAAARMQKALAPYDTELQGLQYQYQDYANLYNQKLATANQAAQVRVLQANENQRVWNQKCQALGFATSAMSYRTPEQQAQLQLQTQQAQNEMNLLYQSKLNDLNLYNKYATTKLENQLQNELTDLSVKDPDQLKANLNNILSDYYENYGDIIKRSQAQAVEDIIAYANKNGISVAQALTENFLTPLQNKAEYKQKVATDYGMLSKQSIATINGRSVIMTQNPNGTISYQYIDDPYDNGIVSTYKIGNTEYVLLSNGQRMTAEEYNKRYGGSAIKGAAKSYNVVDSRAFTADPISVKGYDGKTLYDFISNPNNTKGKTGGQCGHFVNNYLESIGVTDAKNRYYDDNLSTKLNSVNTDIPTVGSIAVFDYNHLSSDGINHGHVGIVTKVDGKGGFRVLDSNYDVNNPGKITERYVPAGTGSCKGFFDPSQPPSNTGTSSTSVGTATDRLTLTALRNGQIVNSKVPETIDQLVKAGFSEDDINEALNQNMEYYLPDDQRAEKNAILNAFRQNDIVQNFQASTEQFLGLSAAVDQANGAGDLASIYMFMRSQDPRSVVREGEFEMAAQTMGLGGQVQTWFTKLANGERLTPEQRQNFIDVTVKVLQAKKQAYKLVYDEAIQQMKAASIPSVYYPTDWASEIDGIISKLTASGNTTGPDNQLNEIYASAMNDGGASGYGYTSYGGYSEDFIQSMISSKL